MKDKDIRKVLLPWIKKKFPRARLSQEQSMYRSSADVVAFTLNNNIVVFEIKSDHDSWSRFPGQFQSYQKAATAIYLVVGEKLFKKAIALPAYVGVILVTEDSFELMRSASQNPHRTVAGVLSLMWKPEIRDLLERHNLLKGYKSKTAPVMRARASANLSIEIADMAVNKAMRLREDWRDSDGKRKSKRRRRRRRRY